MFFFDAFKIGILKSTLQYIHITVVYFYAPILLRHLRTEENTDEQNIFASKNF